MAQSEQERRDAHTLQAALWAAHDEAVRKLAKACADRTLSDRQLLGEIARAILGADTLLRHRLPHGSYELASLADACAPLANVWGCEECD